MKHSCIQETLVVKRRVKNAFTTDTLNAPANDPRKSASLNVSADSSAVAVFLLPPCSLDMSNIPS